MPNDDHQPDRVCPFLDRDDPRCAQRLSLTRLNQAFAYCVGGSEGCPVYHQLAAESAYERPNPEPAGQPSTLTVHGKRAGLARLRTQNAAAGSNQSDLGGRRRWTYAGVREGQSLARRKIRQQPGTRPEPAYLGVRTAGG